MKTYTLTTTIIDNEGVIISAKKKELSPYEVIEYITESSAAAAFAVPSPVVTKRKYTKSGKANAGAPTGYRTRKVPCGECGSKGSRHFKTCRMNGRSSAVAPTTSGKAARNTMSQMTFGRVKISQSHNVTAEKVSSSMDIPLSEVEIAFVSENYSEYQRGL